MVFYITFGPLNNGLIINVYLQISYDSVFKINFLDFYSNMFVKIILTYISPVPTNQILLNAK